MGDPRYLKIAAYTYDLPEERIARYPLAERSSSKLLVYKHGHITGATFRSLADYLPADALLVFNNTRVIHARILLSTAAGQPIECFCLEPLAPHTVETVFDARTSVRWKCMIGNARKWKEEPLYKDLHGQHGPCRMTLQKGERADRDFLVAISWDNPAYSFSELLEVAGLLPIPPYLNRPAEAADEERYNTVYAVREGSVAAPTAGLHFTEGMLEELHAAGITTAHLTLHVGVGTFRQVSAETMQGHEMHDEQVLVSKAMIRQLMHRAGRGQVVAVGTTSARTLESIYWLGRKLMQGDVPPGDFHIDQWLPYAAAMDEEIPATTVFAALLEYMERHHLTEIKGSTRLLIAPGYRFQILDALITNFHQPGSTLLLLVAALTGSDWQRIYDYALRHDYRFLSYGDSSLLYKAEKGAG